MDERRSHGQGRLRDWARWAARPAPAIAHRAVLVLALVLSPLVVSARPAVGQSQAQQKPPPVPDCYHTGSGYGTCEGYVIPGGGTVVQMIYPDKNGIFKLRGPAPLQFTKHVACGDLGCIYNHLDWNYATGAVSGCQVNTSTCNVKLTASQYAWKPVYVRQNNDPAIIYLLWNSGKTGGTISGYVREKNMQGAQQGVPGVNLGATGQGDNGSATTGSAGYYIMNVPTGSYKVAASGGPVGPPNKYQPSGTTVSVAAGGAAHADFTMATRRASMDVSFGASITQGGGLTIGKPVNVPVTITAGKLDLTAVSLAGLTVSNNNLQVIAQAPGTSNFALAAGTSKTFIFQVQGGASGDVNVSVQATATSAVGQVTASAKLPLQIGRTLTIDWKMNPRVPTSGLPVANGLPSPDYLYPSLWYATLYPTYDGKHDASCTSGSTWKWQVTPITVKGKPFMVQPKDGCDPVFQTSLLGTYQVVATQYKKTPKGLVKTGSQASTPNVVLNDLLIVGLGNSNASGEGNPPFSFTQCDRSDASYQYQAAKMLEEQLAGHTSITFVADGCSGAKIQNLYSVPYAGIIAGTPLAPQIKAVQQLIAHNPSGQARRTVDAAFVSIGINNIAFGPTISFCIKWLVSSSPCELAPVEPTYGGDGGISGFTAAPASDTKALTLAQWLAALTAQLPGKYKALQPTLAGLVTPSSTFITEYPTFTSADTAGHICGQTAASTVRGMALLPSTWQWMGTAGAALNGQVDATGSLGWHVVSVNPAAFTGHGYCSSDPWFVHINTSIWNFNLGGPFHANALGHQVSAAALFTAVCPTIATAAECQAPLPSKP